MIGLVRGVFTAVGAAAAGFLIWLAAAYFGLGSTSDFWSSMGLLAGAGLALGLSQLFGGWTKWGWPRVSPGVFVVGFLPTLIVTGWILLAAQPESGWQQGRLLGWSHDIGIGSVVVDMGFFVGALAFALGLVFAFVFDTTGPRTRVVEREPVVADEEVDDVRDRDVVHEHERVATVPSGRTEVRDPAWREAPPG